MPIAVVVLLMMFISISWAATPAVNMNVTDAEVRDVLTALAVIGGVNLVVDDSVSGRITLHLTNIPFETALDIVAKTKGLIYQNIGNVIVVGTAEQMNKGFGSIHIFKLHYARAADIVQLLDVVIKDNRKQSQQEGQQKQTNQLTTTAEKTVTAYEQNGDKITKTQMEKNTRPQAAKASSDRLTVDEATNSIIFSGTPEDIKQIDKILIEVDVPYEQVSLEAQVVAVSKDASKNLGIEWTWSAAPNYPEYDPPEYQTVLDSNGNPVTTQTSPGKYTRDKENMVGTIRFGRSPGGYPYELYYQAKINALITSGNANILARPKVTTVNGKEAVINIGDEVPIPITTTSNNITTTSIEYRNAGIILKYTPRVNADGQITAVVHTEVSTPVFVTELKAYKFTKRSADTEVRLKDGETMVIGGLIGKEEMKAMSKVPFLSDLPFLGGLFKNVNNTRNENEVIIFLTARIVK